MNAPKQQASPPRPSSQRSKAKKDPLFSKRTMKSIYLTCACSFIAKANSSESISNDDEDYHRQRIHKAKLDLWLHGAFALDEKLLSPDAAASDDRLSLSHMALDLEMQAARAPLRHGAAKDVRHRMMQSFEMGGQGFRNNGGWPSLMNNILGTRGGDGGGPKEDYASRLEKQLAELSAKFGQPFVDAIEQVRLCFHMLSFTHFIPLAIECRFIHLLAYVHKFQNKAEHASDCARSCELFYCADDTNTITWEGNHEDTSFMSYSFGSVPPEDFSEEFRYVAMGA